VLGQFPEVFRLRLGASRWHGAICASNTGDGYLLAKVLLESQPLDQKRLVPEGFLCYVCGLQIDPSEKYLARHFVPQIPTETATAYLKDIGIE
jgi:hypothetical protein